MFKPLRNGSELYILIPRMHRVILSSSLLGDALRLVGSRKLTNDRSRIGGSWVAMMSAHPCAHAPDGCFPVLRLLMKRVKYPPQMCYRSGVFATKIRMAMSPLMHH